MCNASSLSCPTEAAPCPPSPCVRRTDRTAMTSAAVVVTDRVGTHPDQHVAAALNQLGRVPGTALFLTNVSGYPRLHRWPATLWDRGESWGAGTGSSGAVLALLLRDRRWESSRSPAQTGRFVAARARPTSWMRSIGIGVVRATASNRPSSPAGCREGNWSCSLPEHLPRGRLQRYPRATCD